MNQYSFEAYSSLNTGSTSTPRYMRHQLLTNRSNISSQYTVRRRINPELYHIHRWKAEPTVIDNEVELMKIKQDFELLKHKLSKLNTILLPKEHQMTPRSIYELNYSTQNIDKKGRHLDQQHPLQQQFCISNQTRNKQRFTPYSQSQNQGNQANYKDNNSNSDNLSDIANDLMDVMDGENKKEDDYFDEEDKGEGNEDYNSYKRSEGLKMYRSKSPYDEKTERLQLLKKGKALNVEKISSDDANVVVNNEEDNEQYTNDVKLKNVNRKKILMTDCNNNEDNNNKQVDIEDDNYENNANRNERLKSNKLDTKNAVGTDEVSIDRDECLNTQKEENEKMIQSKMKNNANEEDDTSKVDLCANKEEENDKKVEAINSNLLNEQKKEEGLVGNEINDEMDKKINQKKQSDVEGNVNDEKAKDKERSDENNNEENEVEVEGEEAENEESEVEGEEAENEAENEEEEEGDNDSNNDNASNKQLQNKDGTDSKKQNKINELSSIEEAAGQNSTTNIISTHKAITSEDEEEMILSSIISNTKEKEEKERKAKEDQEKALTPIKETPSKQKKTVQFSDKSLITISYNEKDKITQLTLFDADGEYVKFKPRNLNRYITLLSSAKPRPIILNSPTSIQEIALETLNNLINEEKEEKQLPTSNSKNSVFSANTEIMQRNIMKCQEIQNNKRQGAKTFWRIKEKRYVKKIIKHNCKKFEQNPQKFFTEDLCETVLNSYDIKTPNCNRTKSCSPSKVHCFSTQEKEITITNNNIKQQTSQTKKKDQVGKDPKKPVSYIQNLKEMVENIKIEIISEEKEDTDRDRSKEENNKRRLSL